MSHEVQVQKLQELLRLRDEKIRKLEASLHHANARSSTTFEPTALAGDYQVASSTSHDVRSASNTVPRSANGGLLVPELSLVVPQGHGHLDKSRPMKRSKTTHPHLRTSPATLSNTKMARSNSTMSVVTKPHSNPFAGSGPITPPCPPTSRHSSVPGNPNAIINPFINQSQLHEPTSGYLYSDNTLNMPPPQLQQMETLADAGREMGVDEFLSMRGPDDMQATTSPLDVSPIQIPSSNGLLSPRDAMHFTDSGIHGLTSACGSLTSGQTLETPPMSRNSSNTMNDSASISGHLSMVRIQSQQSVHGHSRQDSFGQLASANFSSVLGKRPAVESDVFGVGAKHADALAHGYASSAPTDSAMSQHQHQMEKCDSQLSIKSSGSSIMMPYGQQMERSISKDSINSSRSLKLRLKESLNRQNLNAIKRLIQPKPIADGVKAEASEQTDAKKGGKAPITKAKYERPKHPKVMCHQCNEKPEGFRGEHELRRHTEAKHRATVKKWICRDPSFYGIPHSESAIKPLNECKQCLNKKQYGAYYNAAAHLRRTHFKVKPPRKSGGKNNGASADVNNGDSEKRGGNGGGDWPPMSELKHWMVEVHTTPNDYAGSLLTDDLEAMDGLDTDDMDADALDSQYMSQVAMDAGMRPDQFDMSESFAGVGAGFNAEMDCIDPSYSNLQAELSPHHPDMYQIDPAMYSTSPGMPQVMPISSSGFNFGNLVDHRQQHAILTTLSNMEASGAYTSPVSSVSTITPAGPVLPSSHILPPSTMPPPRDDLPDMTFDMAFIAN